MPKHTAALCLALLLAAALPAREDDPEPRARPVKPREIVVAGLPATLGSHDAPTSIPDEKHLAEVVPNGEARKAILTEVNFRRERLLLFSWCGAVGARLTPVEGKAGEAAFEFTPGFRARDCVQYTRLFAVPARAKVKVTEKAG
jgi:hypothetical protein